MKKITYYLLVSLTYYLLVLLTYYLLVLLTYYLLLTLFELYLCYCMNEELPMALFCCM